MNLLEQCVQHFSTAFRVATAPLEPLEEEADSTRIKRIRILSGKANADARAVADYQRFKAEMKNRGIAAEWRTLDPMPTHDRYIITSDAAWNVPPINTIYKGDFSEILKTTTKPPFEGGGRKRLNWLEAECRRV